ncbi:transposase [Rossellomorea sp. YZS02]|uniref:transposase n=1 Tax=Rossellomorea sp. YZS02 TaxID=3097358 RepID=UPI002A10A1A0|nr:transposase [Rossellomorea sp. YZS02]MDX8346133.1 transposase [Rossellomorea sp. YZS02]
MSLEDDQDREMFLKILLRYKSRRNFRLFGYCLMDNHVHLLLKEAEETVSDTIKRISSSYVYWYNKKYDRCGHLFQERFKSENVESSANFHRVLRYIHQNPLKAGLAISVLSSKWTSIREYTHNTSILIDTDYPLQLISHDRQKSVERLIAFSQKDNADHFFDDYRKTLKSDDEVKEYMHRLGVTKSMVQQMDREKRNKVLKKMKQLDGVTVRQLARVSGISKSVIDRVR